MANNDRIYEAYIGNMGEDFKRQTRTRIDWILEQVKNRRNVLDVGCSQGIVSILCAEQGSCVVGVEIQKENVEYANDILQKQYSHLQKQVEFIHCDFMEWESEEKFDAIIITEVIEHLPNCEAFLKRVNSFLAEDGLVVVTTPFGYCNHPDHVHTFFLSSFVEIVSSALDVKTIYFGGKWIGCIATSQEGDSIQLKYEIFKEEEEQFLNIHKELSEKTISLYNNLQTSNQKYKDACESIKKLKEWRENDLSKFKENEAKYTNGLKNIETQCADELKAVEGQCADRIKAVEGQCADRIKAVEGQCADRIKAIEEKCTDKIKAVEELCADKIKAVEAEYTAKLEITTNEKVELEKQLNISEQMLADGVVINDENIKLLALAKKTIQKQQRQIMLMRQDIEKHKKRWNRLENIWFFKIALKIYRKVRRKR